MRSYGKGSLSATTQVKVLSLETFHFAQGQGFHILETNIGTLAKGESVSDVPGSKSVAGKRTVYVGTWENRNAPIRSFQEAEEATRKYGVPVVGLIHSRGVDRVMPVEFRYTETLEGVSSLTQREDFCHAIH
jgi:hypothetical protein